VTLILEKIDRVRVGSKKGDDRHCRAYAQQAISKIRGLIYGSTSSGAEIVQIYTDNRGSLIPLSISALFFYLNFAMGPTILANVIVLLISFVAGIWSFFQAYSDFKNVEVKTAPRAIMIVSGAIVVSIFLLVVTDNFSMGYGP